MIKHIIEILKADHAKNHPDRRSYLGSVEEILVKISTGYKLNRYGDTVFLWRDLPNAGVEFHCYNAAPASELVSAVLEFFQHCRERSTQWCWTAYQHPVISEMFKQNYPHDRLTIEKTETGFEATMRL